MVVIIAEYVWIGGYDYDLRSKSLTIPWNKKESEITLKDLPIWNYDGSSTNQANGDNSEVLLAPVAIYNDPFREHKNNRFNILVLCETLISNEVSAANNNRKLARQIFQNKEIAAEKPWFGLEQEYTLFENDEVTPLGWPIDAEPKPQGPYYCGVGCNNAVGREIANEHYSLCLDAGLQVSGINAEVMKGQWEYQIGPCESITAADQLWMSRYIMYRVCEKHNIHVSFDPKPMNGDWNGAGCHTNYSTLSMRNGAENSIAKSILGLEKTHQTCIKLYGIGNERRMTGEHETSSLDVFTYGVGNRKCSVRIPKGTHAKKSGYIEDRRPASNMDPYLVTSAIANVTIISIKEIKTYNDDIASINNNIFGKITYSIEK